MRDTKQRLKQNKKSFYAISSGCIYTISFVFCSPHESWVSERKKWTGLSGVQERCQFQQFHCPYLHIYRLYRLYIVCGIQWYMGSRQSTFTLLRGKQLVNFQRTPEETGFRNWSRDRGWPRDLAPSYMEGRGTVITVSLWPLLGLI